MRYFRPRLNQVFFPPHPYRRPSPCPTRESSHAGNALLILHQLITLVFRTASGSHLPLEPVSVHAEAVPAPADELVSYTRSELEAEPHVEPVQGRADGLVSCTMSEPEAGCTSTTERYNLFYTTISIVSNPYAPSSAPPGQ